MVLTADEYSLAQISTQWKVMNMFQKRSQAANFTEQCCIDREIQRLVSTTTSSAYKFNCYVVHTAVKFTQIKPLADAGWDQGPTNDQLYDIWRKTPLFSAVVQEPSQGRANTDVNRNSGGLQRQLPADDQEIGCCFSFFSCLSSIFG